MVFLFNITNTILFNLLPRHLAADYLKLKRVTSKLQRTTSRITFIEKFITP